MLRLKDVSSNLGKVRDGLRLRWTDLGLRFRGRLVSVLSIYEDLIGVSQVKESHQALLQAEERFVNSQTERRKAQTDLSGIQEKVREVRFQLDRTPRGQDNYLELIKQEIELIRQETTSREIFEREEKAERQHFTQLSTCLRASYEKERAQSEKTKPLFLIMSVVGGLVGAGVSALSSQAKIRQLKQLILETSAINNSATIDLLRQSVLEAVREENAILLSNITNIHSQNIPQTAASQVSPLHSSPSTTHGGDVQSQGASVSIGGDADSTSESSSSTSTGMSPLGGVDAQKYFQNVSVLALLLLVLYQTLQR